MVENSHAVWEEWAERLRSWRVEEVVATLLEAIGPLNFIGAQLLYFGQPLLRGFVSDGRLEALAEILEEDKNLTLFIAILREQRE
jgi:hypothetical protein